MLKRSLLAHPEYATPEVTIGVKANLVGSDVLRLEYVVVGRIEQLLLPDPVAASRADELWRSTCFEAFLRHENATGYVELNFAPDRRFATYRLDAYRDGLAPALDTPAPELFVERGLRRFSLVAFEDARWLAPFEDVRMNLTAILEATDGTKSYWALAHPPGKPDFHDPACFVATLPAPRTP